MSEIIFPQVAIDLNDILVDIWAQQKKLFYPNKLLSSILVFADSVPTVYNCLPFYFESILKRVTKTLLNRPLIN